MNEQHASYRPTLSDVIRATVELTILRRNLWIPFYQLFVELLTIIVILVPVTLLLAAIVSATIKNPQLTSAVYTTCLAVLFGIVAWWRSAITYGVVLRSALTYWTKGVISTRQARNEMGSKAGRLMIADWSVGISLTLAIISTFLPAAFDQVSKNSFVHFLVGIVALLAAAVSTICVCSIISGSTSIASSFRLSLRLLQQHPLIIGSFVIFSAIGRQIVEQLSSSSYIDTMVKNHNISFPGLALMFVLEMAIAPFFALITMLPYAWIYDTSARETV